MSNLPDPFEFNTFEKTPLKTDRETRKIIEGLNSIDCLVFYYSDKFHDKTFTGCFRVNNTWYLINYDLGNPVGMIKSESRKNIIREVLSYRDKRNVPVTIEGFIWASESIRYELFKAAGTFDHKPAGHADKERKLPEKTLLGRFSSFQTRVKSSLIAISILTGVALLLGLIFLLIGTATSTADDVLDFYMEYHLLYLLILIIFPFMLLIQPLLQWYCPYCNTRMSIKEDVLKYYMNTGAKVLMRTESCTACGYKKKVEMKKGLILEAGEKAPEIWPPDFY